MLSRNLIRRSSALVLAGALAFGTAACGEDDDTIETPDVNVTEPGVTEEETEVITETEAETSTEMGTEMGTETETE